MNDLISVIVPIYNVEKYLNRCIESIVNQTYKNLEIILVDDGSPDACPTMCDEWAERDNRIKVIHKENAGLGFARNSGLDIATGKYVSFIDSDDYISPNMYDEMYKAMKKYNADTCLCGHYVEYTQKIIKKEIPFDKKYFSEDDVVNHILANMIGNIPNASDDYKISMSVWQGLFSNDIIGKCSIRFPSEREYISEDIIFDLSYYPYSKRTTIVTECLYHYCMNGPSLTRSFREDRFEKNRILHNEVINRISEYDDGFKLRENRSFIGRCRQQLVDIIKTADKHSRRKLVSEILYNTEVEKILSSYPIGSMVFRHRIFFNIMKSKNVIALLYYIKIMILRDKLRN